MLVLRDALPADALDVARVHVRAWQHGYRGLLPAAYLEALRPEDRSQRYRFASNDPQQPRTVVASLDEVVRGFATIGPSHDADLPDVGMLDALYVDPDWWGRGIARALIAEARVRLRALGYWQAALWVLVGNDRAQSLYRADGWLPDGAQQLQHVWGTAVDVVRFRTSLEAIQPIQG